MKGTKMIELKDMSCHVWALSGNPNTGEQINGAYTDKCNDIGTEYNLGKELKGKSLAKVRMETMVAIRELCEKRVHLIGNVVYLCGGFTKENVTPDHVWLEDHTLNKTFDKVTTNPDVKVLDRVGREGEQFKPASYKDAFPANQISRVQVAGGYTPGQFESLPLTGLGAKIDGIVKDFIP